MALMRQGRSDMDFLGAMLHGRRSRLAEAERLDTLCRLRTLDELVRAVAPAAGVRTVTEFQRRLVADLVRELVGIAGQTDGAVHELLAWLCVRFQVENLKVLARAFATRAESEKIRSYLVPLPDMPDLDVRAFLAAASVEAFADLIPDRTLCDGVLAAAEAYHRNPTPFFIETALDRSYLGRFLALARPMSEEDAAGALALAHHEADTFHLMLVLRGRFQYGLKPDVLAPFRVPHGGTDASHLASMLAAHDVADVLRIGGRRVLGPRSDETLPTDLADVEALAYDRYWHVANAVFRRNHVEIGALVAYAAIRRIELANLITLSEGIRAGLAPEILRRRLIPRPQGDVVRV